MYIYRLSHGCEEENNEKTIGYFGAGKMEGVCCN